MKNKISEKDLSVYLNELRNEKHPNDRFEKGFDSCLDLIEGKFLAEW